MNTYFHFTTNGTNYLSYPVRAIIGVNFGYYQDKYQLYLLLDDGSGQDCTFTFTSFDFWNKAKSQWHDIERAIENQKENEFNLKYFGTLCPDSL